MPQAKIKFKSKVALRLTGYALAAIFLILPELFYRHAKSEQCQCMLSRVLRRGGQKPLKNGCPGRHSRWFFPLCAFALCAIFALLAASPCSHLSNQRLADGLRFLSAVCLVRMHPCPFFQKDSFHDIECAKPPRHALGLDRVGRCLFGGLRRQFFRQQSGQHAACRCDANQLQALPRHGGRQRRYGG